ncbi:MAG: pitrilysin family protein [Propionicimonas sp.]|nr:pitrilysin family protein [Propionicimonas sp.]
MRHDRRPAVKRPGRWLFPQPARAYLGNGLQVMAFHRPGQYVAAVGLVLDIPLNLEPARTEGVANLVHQCLDEGTAGHLGASFTEALEDTGAVLSGVVGHAATELHLEVPVPHLADALALLAEAVVEPALAEPDVERHRALRLAQLDQLMANSAQRAAIEFRRAVIPGRFREARMAGGNRETVAAVTAGDVAGFHARHYLPGGATLVMCGDFARDPFALADAAFAGWTGYPTAEIDHQVPRGRRPHCRLVHRPGAVQADIRLGGFGIDRSDPRWADLQVASHALGGGIGSRLNRVLREEKGYTYGVHLVDHPMHDGGLLAVQASFRTEVVVDALATTTDLLDLTRAPLTETEVAEAVGFLQGSTPMRYSTARGVTDRVTSLVAAGLSAEFVNSFAASLDHVTAVSATTTLVDLLPLDRLTLVVVGDADALEQPMREAGWDVERR